jgi:EpsI family protein
MLSPRGTGTAPAGRWGSALAVVVGALLLVLAYRGTAAALWTVWTTNDNYSHGPLVPLVALGLVALRRERLRGLARAGEARGLLLVALGCAMLVIGRRADVFALQGWSLIALLFGLSLALLGGTITRVLALPIGYLAFMLTFPPVVMNRLSFALKEVSVSVAAQAATWLGATLQRSGMTLWVTGGALEIEDPCSGLRSLLAMLATGVLFAVMLRGGAWRRLLLIALAVPMAMAGNALRITLLAVTANYAGIRRAVGLFHDVSGYLTYGLSLLGLLAAWALLRPRSDPPPAAAAPAAVPAVRRGGAWNAGSVLVLLAATAGYVGLHPPVNLAAGHGVLRACPTEFGAWSGSELSFEDAVLEELKADDVLVRRYERGGQVAWLTIVYHQNRRYGAHDPRVCYESQGYVVQPLGRHRVPLGDGPLDVNVFRAVRGHERRLVYHWWTTAGLATTDVAAMQRQMALAGALDNRSWGAFVRVEMRVGPGGEVAATEALDDFTARVARALPAVFGRAEGKAGG